MQLRNRVLLILTLMAVSLPAHASPWFPIDTGNLWVYYGRFAGSLIVGAPESFAGVAVQPIQSDSGAREYFSIDESGRVLQHGVTYPDGSYFVFRPPMVRMDSDLTLGHEWESAFYATQYSAAGVQLQRVPASSKFTVIAVGPVTVLAGTFPAAEVLRTEDTGLFPDPVVFRETFAEGVGMILRTDENAISVLLGLEGFGYDGVPIGASTLGKLKSQFGD